MNRISRFSQLACLPAVLSMLLFAADAFAQDPDTGFPPYGSFEDGRFDAVNRQDLNVNFAVPIVSNPGRGMNFNFAVGYDSLIWRKQTVGTTTSWTPAPLWGWRKDLPGGYFNYRVITITIKCFPPGEPWYWDSRTDYSNYTYVDIEGTVHSFPDVSRSFNNCFGTTSGTATGYDGNGYLLDATSPTSPFAHNSSGILLTNGGVITDTNGNFISKSVAGTEATWKDSAGRNALKINNVSSTQIDYKYLDNGGTEQTIRMTLASFPIQTNFQCASIGEYTGTATLPTRIDLPNNQAYQFEYELTPTLSNKYTGRLAKVILPTGGF